MSYEKIEVTNVSGNQFVTFLYTDVSSVPDGSLCTLTSKKGSLFSAAVSIVKLIPGTVGLRRW